MTLDEEIAEATRDIEATSQALVLAEIEEVVDGMEGEARAGLSQRLQEQLRRREALLLRKPRLVARRD